MPDSVSVLATISAIQPEDAILLNNFFLIRGRAKQIQMLAPLQDDYRLLRISQSVDSHELLPFERGVGRLGTGEKGVTDRGGGLGLQGWLQK